MTRHANAASVFASTLLAFSIVLAGAPDARALLTTPQQQCVNALNKAGAKVSSTQGKENSSCVKDATSGNLDQPTTDACLIDDAKDKVAGAKTKTTDAQSSKCGSIPSFGYAGAATINTATVDEELALTEDVYGSPVHAAMGTDDTGKCQAAVTKAYEKLASTRMKAVLACKKDGLKTNIDNATELAACMSSDPKSKVSGAAAKLDSAVLDKCTGVTLATAFPGCSSEAGSAAAMSACIERKTECRMCLTFNAMDNVVVACDQFDNGAVDQTCRQCGNGAAEAPEACDTAGNSPTCDSDCTAPSCGDGLTNGPFGEACDTSGESASCDDDCSLPVCTDGNLNTAAGEVCDDGNMDNGDGCDNNCTVSACGNGITAGGEACDDGNLVDTDACRATCVVATCGDGVTCTGGSCTTGPSGGIEQCDDANGIDTDPCRTNCATATCGDGVLCNGVGCTTGPGSGLEQCDNGGSNGNAPDACRATCANPSCGDSVTDTGESCDTGGNSMTCDSNCTTAVCGDGFINSAANETCDTSGVETVNCDLNCTAAVCGDGTINTTRGELCDDGDAMSGDGCSSTCQNGPGSGEQDPLCPDRGELTLYSKTSNIVCANNGDCTFPRTCNTSISRCETVADLDSGWNGAGHDSDINDSVTAAAFLLCEGVASPDCGECEVLGINPDAGNCRCANNILTKCDTPFAADANDCGGNICNCYFGAPFPLSAQGTPVCVSNRFAVDITGTANPDLGAGAIDASLRTQVFLGLSRDLPCPVCGGKCSNDNSGCIFDSDCTMGATCVQDTPGDGLRNGLCVRDPDSHVGDGVACDIDGSNASFPAILGDTTPGQGGGGYSIDCQPDVGKNISGQGLSIVLQQTTGTASLGFGLDCDAGGVGTALCPCMVCSVDTSAPCDSNADCAALTGRCAGAPNGGGVVCSANADCASANVGPCLTGANVCSKKSTLGCLSNADCLNQNVGPCDPQTCTSKGGTPGAQPEPNFCSDDICTDEGNGEGVCAAGPAFTYCDALLKADGQGASACTVNSDCVGGYGNCTVSDQADCFLDPIVATGSPDPDFPVAGAVFCIPATSNSGVNSSAGLPGPGRVISQSSARTYCASNPAVEYNPGGMPACP